MHGLPIEPLPFPHMLLSSLILSCSFFTEQRCMRDSGFVIPTVECWSLGWTYSNLTCHPSVFTIQGHVDISDNPSPNLTSTSSVLTFPTNITNGSLYWRLLAQDVTGTPCAQESARVYYYLDTNGNLIHRNFNLNTSEMGYEIIKKD